MDLGFQRHSGSQDLQSQSLSLFARFRLAKPIYFPGALSTNSARVTSVSGRKREIRSQLVALPQVCLEGPLHRGWSFGKQLLVAFVNAAGARCTKSEGGPVACGRYLFLTGWSLRLLWAAGSPQSSTTQAIFLYIRRFI